MKPPLKRPSGARGLVGSESARRLAGIVLESWSGACGPIEAAKRMGVALVRYYQLEARALQALIGALEPRPAGRPPKHIQEGEELLDLKHELLLARYQLELERVRSEILLTMPEVVLGKAQPPRETRGPSGGGGRRTKS